MDIVRQIRILWKPLVFAVSLIPAAWVIGDLYQITGELGANPIEEIQDRFGNWGLRFMLIALSVTPLRQISGKPWIGRFRRMLGLFAFFYVFMHFLTWLLLDQGLLLGAIVEDISQRPFITIGFVALLILLAMTLTSTAAMRRRLGRTWQKLHNLVYFATILGVWHYWWQVRLDASEPAIYAIILSLLLGYRIWRRRNKAQNSAGTVQLESL